MRTYLDDLVDEEFRTEGWHSSMRFAAKRIAKRAFAHGVEQTCAAMSLMVGPASKVQPAPVEEPKWFRCDKQHAHDWGCAIDRRVAERRKAWNPRLRTVDCRFGPDRRTPKG